MIDYDTNKEHTHMKSYNNMTCMLIRNKVQAHTTTCNLLTVAAAELGHGRVKLLSKKVRFSDLLLQNVM